MTPQLLKWVYNNKLVVILAITTFSFFVCTVALSTRKLNTVCIPIDNERQNIFNKSSYIFPRVNPHINDEKNNIRLPRNVRPLNYTLRFWPDLKEKIYQGSVKITMDIMEPVNLIEFHVKDIRIKFISTKTIKGAEVISNATRELQETEKYQLQYVDKLSAGLYELFIDFSGRLDKGIVGMYASTMKNGE